MESLSKGKFFVLSLLLIFDFPRIDWVFADTNQVVDDSTLVGNYQTHTSDIVSLLNEHKFQLEKLQELVRNLGELVSRLDSRFSEPSAAVGDLSEKKELPAAKQSPRFSLEEKVKIDALRDGDYLEDKVRDGGRVAAVTVTKYSPFWSERFNFVSAVKLESYATCINVLPFRDFEGLSKYVAVGDDQGRVYVFMRNGDVSVEFYTSSKSPITAMVSYISIYKNETIVITGHENGAIFAHRIWEVPNGEELSSVRVETIVKFASSEVEETGSTVSILDVHYVGRMRYILSVDVSGKIRVFRDNGVLYGQIVPTSRPLAFLKQRLLFLTETGAGSLDLRKMKLRESECEGLNNSVAKNYVFDVMERSKAYGYTSDGDLVQLLLLGDVMNFKCRIRSKKKFDADEPLSLQAIKGYLLIVNKDKAFVFNVSSQHYVRVGGPRFLFSAGLDEIMASFINYQAMDSDAQGRKMIPLIASNQEKLVVISLGNGYVGMYRSNLPLFKNEFNTMLWTSPVLFFILFLFGAWHFFANKKEALTSWGPDDPFSSTSVTNGAPTGSGSGDRSFAESSSRNTDIGELRGGGGLRGPTRRYVSPSQYPAGSASSYRPTSSDTNARPSPVDPNYRTGSELKFRGTNQESTGFPNRRESIYVNNQVVDDTIT